MSEFVGLLHGSGFGVNAYDGFGVGLAEVYPSVGKVDLDAVAIVDTFACELSFDRFEHLIYVDLWGEVDAVFGDAVVREGST